MNEWEEERKRARKGGAKKWSRKEEGRKGGRKNGWMDGRKDRWLVWCSLLSSWILSSSCLPDNPSNHILIKVTRVVVNHIDQQRHEWLQSGKHSSKEWLLIKTTCYQEYWSDKHTLWHVPFCVNNFRHPRQQKCTWQTWVELIKNKCQLLCLDRTNNSLPMSSSK